MSRRYSLAIHVAGLDQLPVGVQVSLHFLDMISVL